MGGIELWQNCPCCRCLFALTPEPSSLEQEVILFTTWSMFRLEQGVEIDTEEKRATSRCINVILSTESYLSRHSGDALCLVEDTPEHSRARMGARFVNPVELDIGHVLGWLSECESRHPRICQPTWNEKLMQTFLVDVKARRIVGYPSAKCDYIALSYVWGGVDQSIPVAGKAGGSLSMPLPATIEDAMSLVNALGKQYLWVDSICINQMDQAEKPEQIGLMSDIYQGAYMTIIAMSGTSANAGLARVGHTPIIQHQAQFSTKRGTVLGIGPTLGYLISQMPWAKRAWTLQEAILSQRCLYLTQFQAYFECNAMQCCESLDISQCCESFQNPRLSVSHDPQDHTDWNTYHVIKPAGQGELRNSFVPGLITGDIASLGRYGKLLEQYRSRTLTYESDAMNAFAGILQAMERSIFTSGFVLGLPVSALHCALLWEKVDADIGKQNREFPSWTWASWSGAVRMAHVDDIYLKTDNLAEGHLRQNLRIWRKGPNGIKKIFAKPLRERFLNESYKWREQPPLGAFCLDYLHKMSSKKAKNVLCIECYALRFVCNPGSPNADIVFDVSGGSDFSNSPRFLKQQETYLVIAATDNPGLPGKEYHLLGIEPANLPFERRVGILKISVHLDQMHALHALRPCRRRVLLI